MKVAFITRSTLHKVPGGDTVQIVQTARHLAAFGVTADICPTDSAIPYADYDLLHFTNITRPADIVYHIRRSRNPFVLSPVLIDYSEYDRRYRSGLSGALLRRFSAGRIEYAKTIARWLRRRDVLRSKSYLWKGHTRSVQEILRKAAMILPNSAAEARRLQEEYQVDLPMEIIPAGIDPLLFNPQSSEPREEKLVLCAARIEGIKNQLNLIRALGGTAYTLLLIGSPAPNQSAYYQECRRIAAPNIIFRDRVPQEELITYYRRARVHALPSWFETCGLSSLEAAAMGCSIAISERGYTRDYFGENAFYCDPADPQSIYREIDRAAKTEGSRELQQKIFSQYTWQEAAKATAAAYRKIIQA